MMEAPRSLLPPQTQEGIYLYQVARSGWHSSAPLYSSTRESGKTHRLDAVCRPLGTKTLIAAGKKGVSGRGRRLRISRVPNLECR
jgi:hypothetical protein